MYQIYSRSRLCLETSQKLAKFTIGLRAGYFLKRAIKNVMENSSNKIEFNIFRGGMGPFPKEPLLKLKIGCTDI